MKTVLQIGDYIESIKPGTKKKKEGRCKLLKCLKKTEKTEMWKVVFRNGVQGCRIFNIKEPPQLSLPF